MGLVLVAACSLGCASRTGWSVSESRTCAPESPARVCVVAEPDHGHVLGLGDVELLPGECVVASEQGRAGLVRVSTRDRQGQRRARWLSARTGKVTLVRVDVEGKLDAERRACDQTPLSLTSERRNFSRK